MRRRPLPPVREVPSKSWRNLCENNCAMYVLVSLVGVLAYANSLNGEFVHDDIPAIVTNGDVNGRNPILRVFQNDFWGTPMWDPTSHKSYRPLTTLSFRLNQWACGSQPWGWHATNVALHAACCTLVLRVALLARLRRAPAAIAAILFAVHPVHTEAVAGIVGRADVLACFFFLTSVLLYHGSGQHRVWWSVLAAALSTLAKETGLTALLFNIAFDLYRCWPPFHSWRSSSGRSPARRLLVAAGALAALAAARLSLLHGALPAFSNMDNPPAFHPSLAVRWLSFCYLAALNWWVLLCPWWLAHDWQLGSVPLVQGLGDPRNLLTCAAFAAVIALLYRCVADLEPQRHPPLAAGVLLLLLPYLPASNLLVTVGFVVAERVLYIPSVGSVLLTAYGIQLLWQRCSNHRLLAAAIAVLVVAGVSRTHLRNRDWRTRETLLRADLAVLPHNAKLHYNFANFLKDTDQQESAIKHYKEALRLWPGYASAHNNLGTLVVGSGRAEHHFLLALRYNKDHVNAHYNLGKLYRKKNRLSEALSMLERCIELEPRFVQAYLELLHLMSEGDNLLALGKSEGDKRWLLDKLVELEPGNWEHRLLYGHWYKERGLMPLAMQQYSMAVQASLRSGRGGPAVRAAALALRATGQRARALQVVIRWHASLSGGPPHWRRVAAARAWRLRREMEGRAALYRRPSQGYTQPTSTCLHHSQLEVSPGYSKPNEAHEQSRTLVYSESASDKVDCSTVAKTISDKMDKTISGKMDKTISDKRDTSISDKVEKTIRDKIDKSISDQVDKTISAKVHCSKVDKTMKKVSIPTPTHFKLTHNKSDIGLKLKRCPLLKKKNIKEAQLAPFVSGHYDIKTY